MTCRTPALSGSTSATNRLRASRPLCHVAGLRWRTSGPRLRAGRPRSQETPVGAESEEIEPVMEAS